MNKLLYTNSSHFSPMSYCINDIVKNGMPVNIALFYSKFRHRCNSQTTLKTTLVPLYKLFLYSCLLFIKLTTPVVLVLAAFLLQRCSNLLYVRDYSHYVKLMCAWLLMRIIGLT